MVGDPAQSSWPLPDEAEQARDEALAGKDQHSFRLSTNYRNSAEVFELAARVARLAVPDPDLPDAVRRTGFEPEHRLVDDTAGLGDTLLRTVTEVAASVEGTVAVVAPVQHRQRVERLLAAVTADDQRIRVLEPLDTKGLEFDGVVVVEPDAVVAESEAGWRTLYVVLTRATHRVVTVGTSRAWLDRVAAPAQR